MLSIWFRGPTLPIVLDVDAVRAAFRNAANLVRARLVSNQITPAIFRAKLDDIPPRERDGWLDLLWDLDEIPDDDPALPRGCVPYLPCPVATVWRPCSERDVTCNDVFVDVGSGTGRTAFLANLLTGAECIGLEIQPALVEVARGRAAWLNLGRTRFVEGDAAELTPVHHHWNRLLSLLSVWRGPRRSRPRRPGSHGAHSADPGLLRPHAAPRASLACSSPFDVRWISTCIGAMLHDQRRPISRGRPGAAGGFMIVAGCGCHLRHREGGGRVGSHACCWFYRRWPAATTRAATARRRRSPVQTHNRQTGRVRRTWQTPRANRSRPATAAG